MKVSAFRVTLTLDLAAGRGMVPAMRTRICSICLLLPLSVPLSQADAAEPPAVFKEIGVETNGAWRLPHYVRGAVRRPDGGMVLASLGDDEERRGETNAAVWIRGEDVLESHQLLPEPTLMDRRGRAWFVGDVPGLPAVATDGTTTNVLDAEDSFQGLAVEDRHGTVWLSERAGVHSLPGDAEQPTWVPTAQALRVAKDKARFHEVVDLPLGSRIVYPRMTFNPRAVGAEDPKPGFLLLLADAKPVRAELKFSGLHLALPQKDGAWFLVPERITDGAPEPGWMWFPPDRELPAELAKLLADLGADDAKVRQAAKKAIREGYRNWRDRLDSLRLAIEDPEVRLSLAGIVAEWGEGDAVQPELPKMPEGRFPGWAHSDVLRTPDTNHVWISVALTHRDNTETLIAPADHFACALLRVDKAGAYELVAADIPLTARPGRLRSEPGGGYDLIPLPGGDLLYRDKSGAPRLVRDGVAHALPDFDLGGDWPLIETRFLAVHGDALLMHQRDRVWWLPDYAARLGKAEPLPAIDPGSFMPERIVERTANEIQNLQRTGGDAKQIDALLTKLIEGNPHRQESYNTRMLLNLRAKKPLSELMPDFQTMLALQPDQAYDYWRTAKVLTDAGGLRRAARSYGAAMRLSPGDPRNPDSRGELYLRVGMFRAAIRDFDEALRIRPGLPMVMVKRADAYAYLEEHDKALKEYAAVIRQFSDYAPVYSKRAILHSQMENWGKALEDHDKAIELDPDNPDFYLRRGNLHILRQAPPQAAKADFEKALEIDPDSPEIKNNLAWMMATHPDPEVRDGRRAVKLATEASEAYDHQVAYIVDTLAASHAEAGDFAQAVKWQQRAIDVADPDDDLELYKAHLECFLLGRPVREPDID